MNLLDFASRIKAEGGLTAPNLLLFSSIDSTNSVGKKFASFSIAGGGDLSPSVLLALEQTKGRGRYGNQWLSPPGGIYASLVVPVRSTDDLATLPMRTGVVLCRELDRIVPTPCRVKWPNDLLVEGRKIGGILIEGVGSGQKVAAIVGFGINYSRKIPDLAMMATSVTEEASKSPPMVEVATRMIRALEEEFGRVRRRSEIVEEYARWSAHRIGDRLVCRTPAGPLEGEFVGFDRRGFLRLEDGDEEHLIAAGEIFEHAGLEHHGS